MNQHARTLLLHLFAAHTGRYLELTYIAPPGVEVGGPRVFTESYRVGTQRIDWQHIVRTNAAGYGCYYALTPKLAPVANQFVRTRETGAAALQCLWVDIDEKKGTSKRDAYHALVHHSPPPTLIIDSGGGLHGIWRIVPLDATEANRQRSKSIMRNMARAFGGDPVQDWARVFRLPGTVNTKPERNGAVCRVIGQPRDVMYEFAWFDSYAESKQAPAPRVPRDAPPDEIKPYLRWYLSTYHAEGSRNNALYWTACRMRDDGYSKGQVVDMLRAHAIANGLSERAVDATIASPYGG